MTRIDEKNAHASLPLKTVPLYRANGRDTEDPIRLNHEPLARLALAMPSPTATPAAAARLQIDAPDGGNDSDIAGGLATVTTGAASP
jgi:hypothetical protein